MKRLFVGLPVPGSVKDYLTGLGGGIVGARWQSFDQMHISLRFIGAVDEVKARDIADNLGLVTAPAFNVELDGIGLFGRMIAPRILWAGLKPQGGLVHLHDKIERALAGLELEPEHQKFTPHITLARFKRPDKHSNIPPRGLEMFLATHGKVSGHGFAVEEFILYRSHLGHEGAAYEALAHYPLTTPKNP